MLGPLMSESRDISPIAVNIRVSLFLLQLVYLHVCLRGWLNILEWSHFRNSSEKE